MKRALRSSSLEKKIHKEVSVVVRNEMLLLLWGKLSKVIFFILRLYKIVMQRRLKSGLVKWMDQMGIVIAIKFLFVVYNWTNKWFDYNNT